MLHDIDSYNIDLGPTDVIEIVTKTDIVIVRYKISKMYNFVVQCQIRKGALDMCIYFGTVVKLLMKNIKGCELRSGISNFSNLHATTIA